MSMEYEGTWDQTHDFEVANAGDNPAPAISGAEGGGQPCTTTTPFRPFPPSS